MTDAASGGRSPTHPDRVPDDVLRAGLERPIATGYSLWARSLGDVLLHTAPLAVLSGLMDWLDVGPFSEDPTTLDAWIGPLLAGYGIALTGVLLSHRHTGLLPGSAYAHALRGFVPWLGTLVLVLALAVPGLFLFVLPGIAIWVRLFWADEFALVHGVSPPRALRESFELTRGRGLRIFLFQVATGFAQWLFLIPAALLFVAVAFSLAVSGLPLDAQGALLTAAGFWIGSAVYAAMHAPEIAYFYGLFASRARIDAAG